MNHVPAPCESAARLLKGMSCSEAVATLFAERLGLPTAELRRAMSCFGGGIGGMGGPCGAVTGAVAVIGLAHAPEDPFDQKARRATYTLVRRFTDEFAARHGSIQCSALTGQDLALTREDKIAAKRDAAKTICPGLMATAESILGELLEMAAEAPAG
ncbi:C-GCAxxG-C-C family protein [Desulfocurvus sp. DL9XJH121]